MNKFLVSLTVLVLALSGCGKGKSEADDMPISISVYPNSATIPVNTSLQFSATGKFADGSTQDLTSKVTWTASNPTNLSISNAMVKGIAADTVVITATYGDKNISGKGSLTIVDATLDTIIVTPSNPTISKHAAQRFVATGSFSNGIKADISEQVVWSSSDDSVASISAMSDGRGLATAAAVDDCLITATYKSIGISGGATLTVIETPLVSMEVKPTNPRIYQNQTQQFSATGFYSDGTTRDLTAQVEWISSDTHVANLSTDFEKPGLALGIGPESTTISAIAGAGDSQLSATSMLNVVVPQLVSLAVTPVDAKTFPGRKTQFTATGNFEDGSSIDLTANVVWSTDKDSVATISNETNAKGLLIAVDLGSVVVTAKSETTGITGNVTLTVEEPKIISISVTPRTVTLRSDCVQQFTAIGTYNDGSEKDVTKLVLWEPFGRDLAANISNAPGSEGVATCRTTATRGGYTVFHAKDKVTGVTSAPFVLTII